MSNENFQLAQRARHQADGCDMLGQTPGAPGEAGKSYDSTGESRDS